MCVGWRGGIEIWIDQGMTCMYRERRCMGGRYVCRKEMCQVKDVYGDEGL